MEEQENLFGVTTGGDLLNRTSNIAEKETMAEPVRQHRIEESLDDYLDYRYEKKGIIVFGNKKIRPHAHQDKKGEDKAQLLIFLEKIKRNRAGIPLGYVKQGACQRMRPLSAEEAQRIQENPHALNIQLGNITERDLQAVAGGLNARSRCILNTLFLPFLVFLFMLEKGRIRNELATLLSLQIADDEQKVRRRELEDEIRDLHTHYGNLEEEIARIPTTKKGSRALAKRWLTRRDLVVLYLAILQSNYHEPIKNVALVLFAFYTGYRPAEICRLRIEKDLVLNEEGWMKVDEHGFGEVRIRDEISKAGGADKILGTLIPPTGVHFLNIHLANLYRESGRRDGYLFRKYATDPQSAYLDRKALFGCLRNPMVLQILHRYPDFAHDHVTSRDFRRSVNNMILYGTRYSKEDFGRQSEIVARLHLRHAPKDVNEASYQNFPRETYRQILEESVGFPFDIKALEEWEESTQSPAAVRTSHNEVQTSPAVERDMSPMDRELIGALQSQVGQVEQDILALNSIHVRKTMSTLERSRRGTELETLKVDLMVKMRRLTEQQRRL